MTNHKLYADVQMVSIDEIKPSPFINPNEFSEELFASLKKDIEQHGLVGESLIVNPKNMTLIQGHHRLRALKELGYPEVPCIFYEPADETEQKILSISWNQKRGTFNEQRLHNLIKSIYDSGKYPLEEMKDLLGFNVNQLREKLETIKVDENLIRKIEQEAMESEKNMPVLMNFAVNKEHENLVIEALQMAEGKTKGEKLACVCREYLYKKIDEDKPTR